MSIIEANRQQNEVTLPLSFLGGDVCHLVGGMSRIVALSLGDKPSTSPDGLEVDPEFSLLKRHSLQAQEEDKNTIVKLDGLGCDDDR